MLYGNRHIIKQRKDDQTMTNFNDRERAEEKKFQLSKEQEFQATMRRNKLFAEWLAGQVGGDKTAIVDRVVDADFEKPGSDDVVAAAMAIAKEKGKSLSAEVLNKKLHEYHAIAKQQVSKA